MAQTATNVTAAKPYIGGAVYYAPVGTTLPTDATSELAEAWKSLGYVSEDGVTNSSSPDSSDIIAWGGDKVLTVSASKEDTFSFTLIETLLEDVQKVVFGEDNVTGSMAAGMTIKANNNERKNLSYVVWMVDRGGAHHRIVIPSASVSEIGDITYTDDEAVGYEITLSCEPDSAGNTHYEYRKAATAGV